MSQKSITELNINSITLSNSNYAGLTGYTAQSSTLETNNAGVLLVNGVPISSGGGGAVDAIDEGDGISVVEDPTGTFTISNTGVIEVTAGDGISIADSGSGSFEITNTVNPADFLTTTAAAATYQTQANMAAYSTTAQANGLYQPVGAYLTASSLTPYSTTVQANGLYQPVGAYLTASSLNPYSTTAQANGLYPSVSKFGTYTITYGLPAIGTGLVNTGSVTIPNFIGSDAGSVYFININYDLGFDATVFNAICSFERVSGTGTVVYVSIRNNGPSTTQQTNLNLSILGVNLAN
jgi:hypothetical protein